jgi:transposase
MNVHKNARLTRHGRERIVRQVESGQTPEAVAEAAGVCPRTVRKWVDRYRREGLDGLNDRSSRPHRLRQPTGMEVVEMIERLRRQRWTGKQIAAEAGVSPATVSRVLRRLGLNKLSALEPEPVRRYEREHPGELIHLDIKKLGRIGSVGHRITGRRTGVVNRHLGIGWEFVHVCIDDASRVAFVQVMPDERQASAVAFLEAAVAYYVWLGIRVERVMTDNVLSAEGNGACSQSLSARQHALAA